MPAKKKKQSIEDALRRLEDIAGIIENPDTPIEKSLEFYKEGVELSVYCAEILEGARQEITVLHKTAEGIFEKPYVN